MRAIQANDYGGPEVLKLVDVPAPQPKAGQVLVKLYAAGVNPADWKYRSGMMKAFMPVQFPWIPGLEGAGRIEAGGEVGSRFQIGQAVYGPILASYAEYAVASAADLQPMPANLSFDQAATVPVGALTAWGAAIVTAQVKAGQRVLVHGAAGGVGLFAVQLAMWKGAHVIGTASAANIDLVRSLGVEEALDYRAKPFETVVHEMDVVIDTVGGDLYERSLKVLRPGGIFVTVAGRPDPELAKAAGVRMAPGGRAPVETLGQISELIASGQIKAVVGRVFPLEGAAQAHELSQTGHGRGRIVLHIAD
jgi:NADPH:quinone reductase-like Zn-dependent oxidoreductase